MSSKSLVSASTVRDWFASAKPEGVPAPGSRGRLHPDIIAAFHKANPRKRYETASVAEKRTVEVPGVKSIDKAGRMQTRTVTITTETARGLLTSAQGKRGRFAKGDLALALSGLNANEVSDKFTK